MHLAVGSVVVVARWDSAEFWLFKYKVVGGRKEVVGRKLLASAKRDK